jgi:DNA-binding IclR family transcriptional regulator
VIAIAWEADRDRGSSRRNHRCTPNGHPSRHQRTPARTSDGPTGRYDTVIADPIPDLDVTRPDAGGRGRIEVDAIGTKSEDCSVARNEPGGAGPGVVESAFGLLEALRELGRARVSDLAEEYGLPRTTVYRLLGQLADVGAVDRIGMYYRLGPSLLTLGEHVTPMDRLRIIAQRPMIELAAATPVHVYLCTTTSDMPIYLDIFRGRERLPFRSEPGEPMPARSACARALASRIGCAVDDGGIIDGVSCAAQAIPLPHGAIASLGIVAPLPRLPRALLGPMRKTAHRIATQLALQSQRQPT